MSERRGLVLLGVAALLLLLLRLAALFFSPLELQFDEAQYWSWAQDPAWGYYSKPPLIAWTIAITTGLCGGDSEACVRLAAPVLHLATAFFVAVLLRCLGMRPLAAALSGFAYLTLPGAALGSFVLSTDTVLLPVWTLTLIALWRWRCGERWIWALASGLGLGVGLLAKYAMIYLPLCALIWLAFDVTARRLLLTRQGVTALALAAVIIAPHAAWNAAQGWPTLGHTVDNANWHGQGGGILNALEFLAGQALIFGPLLMLAIVGFLLMLAFFRPGPAAMGRSETTFLLVMALPIIVIVTVQAGISRAHANWAAPAVITLTALIVPVLLRVAPRLLGACLGVNVLLSLAVIGMVIIGPAAWLPGFSDAVMHRMTGQQRLSVALERTLGTGYDAAVFDDRETLAAALYYLCHRDTGRFRMAHPPNRKPDNHYSLTRPFDGTVDRAVLVARHPQSTRIAGYRRRGRLSKIVIPTVGDRVREIAIFELRKAGS